MQKKTLWLCRAMWLVCSGTCALTQAQVVVIGYPLFPAAALSAEELQALYLGTTDRRGEMRVAIVDQPAGSTARDEFDLKVLQKNPQQMKAHWAKLVFSGQAMPPKVLADDKAVKKWVGCTPGAVGYVDSAMVDKSVKVLFTP
jgi:ABC-type phosphate transport system substrate-binding protein